ncbi:MAG: hypothetical protein DWP97_14530 [Calditrichaeota bacterium]|nr:MAG: hypothetical protein DWP97_14530 [Calditrichota bacterium]
MKSLREISLFIAVVCMVVFIGAGCSDDTIVTYVDSIPGASQSQVESFFPLSSGYTTIYNVSYQSSGTSEIVTFRAGDKEQFQSVELTPWYGFSNSTADTGYFYTSANALYYMKHLGDSPDKVLEFPLSIGSSWDSDGNDDIYTDIITGEEDSLGTGGGIYGKTFPTISAVQYIISEIDGVTLENGVFYSKAVLVSTYNGNKTNYYWYVNGVGLVRYVIGATEVSFPNGDVVGELVQYGY